jgi:ABC-2 type transport system permease protein
VLRYFEGWAPRVLVDAVAACSLLTHFESLQRGVVDLRDVTYFASVMVFALAAAHLAVNTRKAA